MTEQRFIVREWALLSRFGVFAGLSILLLILDTQGLLKPVRSVLATLVYPLHITVGTPVTTAQWLSNTLTERSRLLAEQNRLQADNRRLHSKLLELEALRHQNVRLRKLLSASARLPVNIQLAEVMPLDLAPFSHKIKIDLGLGADIKAGASVVNATGILGRITQIDAAAGIVTLITAPDQTVPVEIVRNKLETLARGSGVTGDLSLLYLQNTADIEKGDQLVTSGRGGRFPEGYPVGVVTRIKRDISHTYLEARARPYALKERNREVLVLLPTASADAP